jgi:XTP/dITP diphosphohydrolase
VTDGGERLERGVVDGTILLAPRGEEGFGYDPLFEVAGLGRTFAELDRESKARLSHRGRAFTALLATLERAS